MITGINHLTWNVVDIDISFDFYVNLLGFKPVMKSEWSAYFLAGDVWIAITLGQRVNNGRYDHTAFNVEKEDYEAMVRDLLAYGVQQWQDNQTEGDSFYFLDPSGNKFELHYSNLNARVKFGKENWPDNVEWYVYE